MDLEAINQWMLAKLEQDGCLYQDDAVDHIVKSGKEEFLRQNSEGNQVLSTKVLSSFRKSTEPDVVWVKPDKYWRYRVTEDEEGRDARGQN